MGERGGKTFIDDDLGRVGGGVRHEAGHAANDMLDLFSETPVFKAAHAADVADMPRSKMLDHDYYISANNKSVDIGTITSRGRDEAFAEISSTIWGGGNEMGNEWRFKTDFPRTMTLVQKLLEELNWLPK
jgi:hypothetical protein